MEKESIVATIWAFAACNQPLEAIAAANLMRTTGMIGALTYQDKILEKVSNHYLRKIKYRKSLSRDEYAEIITTNLELVYEISNGILESSLRKTVKKRIIMKGLECLKRPDLKIDGWLTEFLQKAESKLISPHIVFDQDSFARKIIEIYLGIPRLKGQEAVEVIKLMNSGVGLAEAERRVDFLIGRGYYEALKSIGRKYGRLGEAIAARAEELVLACLKHQDIDTAVKALSLIPNPEKRKEYYKLFSLDETVVELPDKD